MTAGAELAGGGELAPGFFALPAALYQQDPFWLGENSERIAWQFSADNAFFEQGKAWAGCIDNQVRVAGFIHPRQRIDGQSVAYFGFWETRNNIIENRRLFGELEQWAKQSGATALYGPIDFSTYGNNRLRLTDFEQSCFPGEPYNPDYYPALLQQLGFEIAARYQTRFHRDTGALQQQLQPGLEQFRRQGSAEFELTSLQPEFWLDHLDELYPLVDIIFRQNFAYSPVDIETFKQACGAAFARRFCPHSSVVARTRDGMLAGFFLSFPDYSPLLRVNGNRHLPADELNFADHFEQLPQPRLALAKTGGVLPQYRRSGLFNWMGYELVERAAPHYRHIAGALMREDNYSMRFGQVCPIQRDYGLFRKSLSN